MIIKADKNKVLKEFQEKYVVDRYKEEFTKIIEKYKTNREEIKENLTTKFNSVCKEAISLQEKELKGEIRYIYFSMLRTRLLEDKGIWRIDLYDEKWFLDKEECSINIDLDFIYESLFNHMKELAEKKKEYGRTIKEKDIQVIKLREANKYHSFTLYLIKDLLKSFLEDSSYKEIKKKDDISIMIGEYMDTAMMIYPKMIK
ncbi:hypothetical protein [Clostridium saccharobutylicum]|uniref:Uncharacterized protein n=1 Tax=Clostridium saccharobutylicum DSM 13864 TaxID=1345695 RepID=U5MWY6_CLOSA|nr:hypothetical protein [Clostridium saccharobutylicum]AGX44146.1 hypothetical protein CLSA_c31800 [Clostridium saccharobutylicum DSM 13864]AQR91434.1 hypothetical protein CLOSC_31590 [Clostridium saccharobutylicum]AQS01338.1 hypothetical protein CSACC_31660 [Clostridium saccharobutylicum]AQS15321.1 hypothetical protein CLOSACC_31660 [Clostridium saccharobutylicum]MBA2905801.1 hypothetical protein [Clostridium saccharobutylicum]